MKVFKNDGDWDMSINIREEANRWEEIRDSRKRGDG